MGRSRPFADRADAGRRLAAAVPALSGDALVVGLARGGVPVAAEVARARGALLDVLVVRKVGHPRQPEYALGAVSEDGIALPPGLPDELVEPQLARAREQAIALRAGAPRVPLVGRSVVVVDDGVATGRSMAVALETARRAGAGEVVMAVPVASGPAFRALAQRCDAHAPVIVEPPEFLAVGQFYDDFAQVSDAEVTALLLGTGDAQDGDPLTS
jgi:putative phosphoribosyl transferase